MKGRKMSDNEFLRRMAYLERNTQQTENLHKVQQEIALQGLSCLSEIEGELKRRGIKNPFKKYDLSSLRNTPLTSVDKRYESNGDKILTTEEACAYLGISRPTYLNYIYDGAIHGTKIGKGWKVYKSELDRFMKSKIS